MSRPDEISPGREILGRPGPSDRETSFAGEGPSARIGKASSGSSGAARSRFVLHAPATEERARKIAEALHARPVRTGPGELGTLVRSLWEEAEALIFLFSLPVTVRTAGPLLSDKETDPAILCIPEDGSLLLPVAGCHLGGGLDLAREAADRLGIPLVATTSTDRAGLTAPDLWARRRGWKLAGRDRLAGTIRAFLETGRLAVWIDPLAEEAAAGTDRRSAEEEACRTGSETSRVSPPVDPSAAPSSQLPLPEGWVPSPLDEASVLLTPRFPEDPRVRLIPPCLVLGTGCRKEVPPEAVEATLRDLLGTRGFAVEAVREIRTIPRKMEEPGLIGAARRLEVPLVPVEEGALRAMAGPFSESAAERHLDLPGVAEPCAASAGRLLGARIARNGVTAAAALAPLRFEGSLTVVGTGPGEARFLTAEATAAIRDADAVVGYALYVDQIPGESLRGKILRRFTMGEEEFRVRTAVDLARRGYSVALVCGGDPILFGLAGLTRRLSPLPVRVVPGISAAQAAGAILGAPYTNGLVQLSLSDYLQPWSEVVRELECAAASGMATACYNPVRRGLEEKLAVIRRIFAGRICLLIRDAGRPDEEVLEVPAEDLTENRIDMRTLIFFPPPRSRREEGPDGRPLWLDPRGYRSETGGGAPPERATTGETPSAREPGKRDGPAEGLPRNENAGTGGKVAEHAPSAKRTEAEQPRTFSAPGDSAGPGNPVETPLVLVLGGTTEGRTAASVLLEMGLRVLVSVATPMGRFTAPPGTEVRTGRLDGPGWSALLRELRERGLAAALDGAHPFASAAHAALAGACADQEIPLAILRREIRIPEGAETFRSIVEAARAAAMATPPGESVFLAVGVKELAAAAREIRAVGRELAARVLPTAESVALAEEAGLAPGEILGLYGPGDEETNRALFRAHRVGTVVTKASGGPGGLDVKARAARAAGARLFCVVPPDPPEGIPLLRDPGEIPDWIRGIRAGEPRQPWRTKGENRP